MAPEARRVTSNPGSDWLAAVMLGAISGVALLSLGMLGLVPLAATLLLVAWKGPRLLAGAGVLTGLGLIWSVLFARVGLTCGPASAASPVACEPGDIWLWVGAAAALFITGLVASAWALRMSRR